MAQPRKNFEKHPSPAPLPPAHLDEKGAAAVLNVSVRTLQAWRLKGGGPPFAKIGASVRYNPDTLARWLEVNTVTSTSGGPAAA